MTLPLSRPYPVRGGLPVAERVNPHIFTATYFAACMDCDFCFDACCQYGATLDAPLVEALLARADDLEAYLGVPRQQWFRPGFRPHHDYPGGRYTRTRVIDGSCVFLNRQGRGCLLHRYALERGLDVHTVKPMACTTFPVLCEDGVLQVPDEIRDGSLTCLVGGPTLYRSAREDLGYFFGLDLIAELDALEAAVLGRAMPEAPRSSLNLPVLPLVG
ncbi:MAG TPA: hypothetical protein VJ739_07360 [Gemmataceae bacterium]|nr:hypothetical protein [Gemmataceae bacterium]